MGVSDAARDARAKADARIDHALALALESALDAEACALLEELREPVDPLDYFPLLETEGFVPNFYIPRPGIDNAHGLGPSVRWPALSHPYRTNSP
jgi:hypothetical protein